MFKRIKFICDFFYVFFILVNCVIIKVLDDVVWWVVDDMVFVGFDF